MQHAVAATPITLFHNKSRVWYQAVYNCVVSS